MTHATGQQLPRRATHAASLRVAYPAHDAVSQPRLEGRRGWASERSDDHERFGPGLAYRDQVDVATQLLLLAGEASRILSRTPPPTVAAGALSVAQLRHADADKGGKGAFRRP